MILPMKSMKKLVLGLVALSIAFQPVVRAVSVAAESQLKQVCPDEVRSSGGIARARFLYQKVQNLPSAQFTVRFGNQESEQDLIEIFSSQQMQNVAKTSILPGVKSILEILTKEMADFAQGSEKLREVSIHIEFPAKSQLEVRSPTAVSKLSKDVVTKFTFKKTTATAKQAAPMTVEVATYGFASKMPVHLLNLFKALLLDDSFAQKYGMICVGSVIAVAVVGVFAGVVVRKNRVATQQDLGLFDGLAQKMCNANSHSDVASLPYVFTHEIREVYAVHESCKRKTLAVDLKTPGLFGPTPITEFKYDNAQHADKDLIVATVFFEGQLGQLAESLKWPYVADQTRKLIIPRKLLPTEDKELKIIAACLTYGRWELVVVDAKEKMSRENAAKFFEQSQRFMQPVHAVAEPKSPGEYFSTCSLVSVVFAQEDTVLPFKAKSGSSSSVKKAPATDHECAHSSYSSASSVIAWNKFEKCDGILLTPATGEIEFEGSTAATLEEKQKAIVRALPIREETYPEKSHQFPDFCHELSGWRDASRCDEYPACFLDRPLVVDFNDEVMRDVILRHTSYLENTIVVFVYNGRTFKEIDIEKQCKGLQHVAVLNNTSNDCYMNSFKQIKFGQVCMPADYWNGYVIPTWECEISLHNFPQGKIGIFDEEFFGDSGLGAARLWRESTPGGIPPAKSSARRGSGFASVSDRLAKITSARVGACLATKLNEAEIEGGARVIHDSWRGVLSFQPKPFASTSASSSYAYASPQEFVTLKVYLTEAECMADKDKFRGPHSVISIILPSKFGEWPKFPRTKHHSFNELPPEAQTVWNAITDDMIHQAVEEAYLAE